MDTPHSPGTGWGWRPTYLDKLNFPVGDGTEPDTSLIGRALRTGEITISTDLTQSEPAVAGRLALLELGFSFSGGIAAHGGWRPDRRRVARFP